MGTNIEKQFSRLNYKTMVSNKACKNIAT